jgi:hypothetical protein
MTLGSSLSHLRVIWHGRTIGDSKGDQDREPASRFKAADNSDWPVAA